MSPRYHPYQLRTESERENMAAYVITDVEITDADLYRQFMKQVTETIESHGGKFVARGGALDVISGDWMPKRSALL